MEPAGHRSAEGVLQSDLGTVGHLQGLALCDPSQPSLGHEQTGAGERQTSTPALMAAPLSGSVSGAWVITVPRGSTLPCDTKQSNRSCPDWQPPRGSATTPLAQFRPHR